MSKRAKKRSPKAITARVTAAKPPLQPKVTTSNDRTDERGSKQSRVIAMLESPIGTTIDAVMKATGWQQHSVRGFLAGVVRKRLKLRLDSKRIDGERVYRIILGAKGKSGPLEAKHRLP